MPFGPVAAGAVFPLHVVFKRVARPSWSSLAVGPGHFERRERVGRGGGADGRSLGHDDGVDKDLVQVHPGDSIGTDDAGENGNGHGLGYGCGAHGLPVHVGSVLLAPHDVGRVGVGAAIGIDAHLLEHFIVSTGSRSLVNGQEGRFGPIGFAHRHAPDLLVDAGRKGFLAPEILGMTALGFLVHAPHHGGKVRRLHRPGFTLDRETVPVVSHAQVIGRAAVVYCAIDVIRFFQTPVGGQVGRRLGQGRKGRYHNKNSHQEQNCANFRWPAHDVSSLLLSGASAGGYTRMARKQQIPGPK